MQSPQSLKQYQTQLVPQPLGTSTQAKRDMIRQRLNVPKGMKLTPEGIKFLKCAFSAADFDGSGTYGVPDSFSGLSTAVKHRFTDTRTLQTAKDLYLLLLPIPGYSHFSLVETAGVPLTSFATFDGIPYSDFNSIYEPELTQGLKNVTKFRVVSNHIEIIPTTNQTTWSGSIQVFKVPVQVTLSDDPNTITGVVRRTISGLQGLNTTNANQYSGPFNLGAYAGSYQRGSTDWQFKDIWKYQGRVPESIQDGDFGTITPPPGGYIPGYDNDIEATLIKISGVTSELTFILKTWQCTEYQFLPGTLMYEMQNLHNVEDRLALELYRRIVMELPTAVSFIDNDTFWERVLRTIQMISGGLAVLPGPYGVMAGGVNALTTGLQQLMF